MDDPSGKVNGFSRGEASNVRWKVPLDVLLRLSSSPRAFGPPPSSAVVEYDRRGCPNIPWKLWTKLLRLERVRIGVVDPRFLLDPFRLDVEAQGGLCGVEGSSSLLILDPARDTPTEGRREDVPRLAAVRGEDSVKRDGEPWGR